MPGLRDGHMDWGMLRDGLLCNGSCHHTQVTLLCQAANVHQYDPVLPAELIPLLHCELSRERNSA